MSHTHKEVVSRWYAGKSGKGFNMTTDGKNLFSYAMLIGRTLSDGTKQVLNVRSQHAYSVSTSQHVSLAIGRYTEVIEPIHVSRGYSGWRVFPENLQVDIIRYTSKVWKTLKGAENALKALDNPLLSVATTYGGYTLVFRQYTDAIGHVVSSEVFYNLPENKGE